MFGKKVVYDYNEFSSNGRLYDGVFIPSDFENIILRHVILNCMKLESFHPAPLLLLQGKKGEGKTFMTETILKGNGIYYKNISSSILAGNNENDAVNNLMLYYNKCQMNAEQGKFSALVIDDFHLSIAVTKNHSSHTTNADTLLSALMNIADKKSELKAPIILIGNNFTDLYAPLTRLGRMNISTWSPTIMDKVEIIKRLIIKHNHDISCISTDIIKKFIEYYNNQYIGFYEQVIENVIFQDFKKVTDAFAVNKGNVSYQQLLWSVQNSISEKKITINALYEEANKLINKKLEKLDN